VTEVTEAYPDDGGDLEEGEKQGSTAPSTDPDDQKLDD
jgi:hypothetical protein